MPTADKADVDDEVAAAKRALFMWRDVPGSPRCDMLLKLANLLAEHQQRLAEWDTGDNGTPKVVARRVGVDLAIELFRYFVGWAAKDILVVEEIKHLMRWVWHTENTYGTGATAWESAMANLKEQDDKHLIFISGPCPLTQLSLGGMAPLLPPRTSWSKTMISMPCPMAPAVPDIPLTDWIPTLPRPVRPVLRC